MARVQKLFNSEYSRGVGGGPMSSDFKFAVIDHLPLRQNNVCDVFSYLKSTGFTYCQFIYVELSSKIPYFSS